MIGTITKIVVAPLVTTLLIGGVVTLFSACKHDAEVVDPCVKEVPVTVSFSNDLLPLFRTTCAMSGCHSGGSPAAHLNLVDSLAYSQLLKPGTGNVDTVQPGNSILYGSLTTSPKIMPPAGKLDVCTIEMVKKWIEQGAKNN